VKERVVSGFNASRTMILTSKTGITVEERRFSKLQNWRHYLSKTRVKIKKNWHKDGRDFCIVTGDEKWVHYDKRRKSWGVPDHASMSMAKPNIHGSKVLHALYLVGASSA